MRTIHHRMFKRQLAFTPRVRAEQEKQKMGQQQSLARHAAAHAAAQSVSAAFWANARRAAKGRAPLGPAPKGMRGSGLFVRGDQSGQQTIDPVSLDRIPARRAVLIGKQQWNSKTIRELLKRDSAATNPLTRQPFPAEIYEKYGKSPFDEVEIIDVLEFVNMARGFLENKRERKLRMKFGEYVAKGSWERGDLPPKNVSVCWKSCRARPGAAEVATVYMDNNNNMVVEIGRAEFIARELRPMLARTEALFKQASTVGGYKVIQGAYRI